MECSFAYDGMDRRVSPVEKLNGVEQANHSYLWIGSTLAQRRDATGSAVQRNYFSQGFQENGENYHYTKDHLGSIREVVASDGVTIESAYDYSPWGEDTERKRLGFEKMSSGWAKGTQNFKKAVLDDLKDDNLKKIVESEAVEMREPRWEGVVADSLKRLNKQEVDLAQSPKAALWKLAIARYLREQHLVPYRWIAKRLNMGQVSFLSSAVSRSRRLDRNQFNAWGIIKKHENLD